MESILFYLVLIALGFLFFMSGFTSDKPAIFFPISIIGLVIGFAVHQIIVCTVTGISIGSIVAKICEKIADDRLIKKISKEQHEKTIRYVESRKINSKLSNNIKNYLKTGKVLNDYYEYYNYSCCSDRINKQICDMVNCYKDWLLQNVNNPKYYKDYQTSKGLIREVKIGGIIVYALYEKYRKEEIEMKFGITIVEYFEGNELENWRRIIRDHGFDYKVNKEADTENNYFWNYFIYAYVRM